MSSLNMTIDRVKKHAIIVSKIIQPLVDEIDDQIDNAKNIKYDTNIILANCINLF